MAFFAKRKIIGARTVLFFVYDSVGNLIEDKSKKMRITYDWRGMPM